MEHLALSEISDDDDWGDGIDLAQDGRLMCFSPRGVLAKMAKINAITLQQAADLFGMSPRQFKRLLGGPHFPDIDQGVIRVGSFTFYDKDIVSIYVKKYRVGRIRLSLRKKNISKSRRRDLEAKLKREKARLYVRLVWDETSSERKQSVEYILNSIQDGDQFYIEQFRQHFGPDDDERREEVNTAISRELAICGLRPTAIPDVLNRAKRVGWMLDKHGRVVLRGDDGNIHYGIDENGIAPLTLFEWVNRHIRHVAPHFFNKLPEGGDRSDAQVQSPSPPDAETLH